MSIEGQHAYRFGYLKSEQWKTVRVEALAREKGKCQICGEESISNDAHHIWYPENIYETAERHLVILCRPCHDFLHTMIPECKTGDEEQGREMWLKFRNAISAWRLQKAALFTGWEWVSEMSPTSLRRELKRLQCLVASQTPDPKKEPTSPHYDGQFVFAMIKKWHRVYKQYSENGNSLVEDTDYKI